MAYLLLSQLHPPQPHAAQFVVEDVIAEGDKDSTQFTMRATHEGELRAIAPSGKGVTMTGIDTIRLS